MKIYIITFSFTKNFGADLQKYALYKYLSNSGHDVLIVDYRPHAMQERLKPHISSLKQLIIFILELKRRFKFERFNKKYISFTNRCITTKDIQKLDAPDVFIAGSDQIWNSDITGGIDDGYFLNFDTKARKVFYAASIGKDHISDSEIKKIKSIIQSCDAISVREHNLCKLLQQNDFACPKHVLDPVFLLGKEEYRKVSVSPKIHNYVLIYQLDYNEECYEIAYALARKHSLIVLELGRYIPRNNVDALINGIGPDEFLGLIDNAAYVVTNSFHGVALSILFEKEFYAVKLDERNSRASSLLASVGLSTRMISSISDLDFTIIDYKTVNNFLEDRINESKEFLYVSINEINTP